MSAPVRPNVYIIQGGLDDPRVVELVRTHVTRARAATARCSAHALDLSALRAPDITFWSAWFDVEGNATSGPVGVGALRRLTDAHGEIKSMYTDEHVRGRGVGSALVRHIVTAARLAGMQRLSLETGARPYFAPARALYARHGFVPCDPFGEYRADPNSVFMTLEFGAAPHAPSV